MEQFKKVLLVPAIASVLALTACGGGSSSSSDSSDGSDNNGNESATVVSGTVEVPAASASAFADQGSLAALFHFFISPAAAALLGLEAVEGALVELIRIDNEGNPVGDPIDTTYTSISGDYELELPPGVDLSGDLIVRITGTNDASLRAMVVEQDVDINPVTDFVARKFIESDADLGSLEVTDVVELKGKANAFDLTASPDADIEAMLAVLESELGEFVESAITNVSTEDRDPSSITGEYRSTAFSFDLHDGDNSGYGTLGIEIWLNDMVIASDSDGATYLQLGHEEGADTGLSGPSLANGSIWFDTWMDDLDERFPATYLANGVLAIESSFEEELETDDGYGWRWPPMVYNLQQVRDDGLFVLLSQEASVRYGLNDAKTGINPDDKQGDEISRALEFFARKPSGMTAGDMVGDFGRVYLESRMDRYGSLDLMTETSVVTFSGTGELDAGAATGHSLNLTGSGTQYYPESDPAEDGLSVVISDDGDIESIGGEDVDGFVNDAYNFASIVEADGAEGVEGQVGQTLMVKLPDSKPSVAGKRYRVMSLTMTLDGTSNYSHLALATSQHNTFLTMDTETAATVEGKFTTISMETLGGDMEVSKSAETETISDVTVAIEANGAMTITVMESTDVPDVTETTLMEGFFNEDASMALLTNRYGPTDGDPNELGLTVLIEVTE